MKKLAFPKKYPLLVSTIISCLLIVVSLFILGFFGLKLGVSLGGGSRFEVALEQTANVSDYSGKIKDVLGKHGMSIDTSFTEDNYRASVDGTGYLRKRLVVQVAKKDISAEEKAQIRNEVVTALGINPEYVSEVEQITSSVRAKEVLFIALAFGIIAICFFVFGWLRYGVFIGLSFIIAFLHNIILYLSMLILTRIPLTAISLVAALILTLVMSVVLIAIFEKFRELSNLSKSEKSTVSERMLLSERQTVLPYVIVMAVALIVSVIMLFVPSNMVRVSALGAIIAIIVTLYTTLIIGPASSTGILEIREMNQKAILSRNETVNKAIKKKIKKSAERAATEQAASAPAPKEANEVSAQTPETTENQAKAKTSAGKQKSSGTARSKSTKKSNSSK